MTSHDAFPHDNGPFVPVDTETSAYHLDEKTRLFFDNLIADERIDQALEDGEHATEFHFAAKKSGDLFDSYLTTNSYLDGESEELDQTEFTVHGDSQIHEGIKNFRVTITAPSIDGEPRNIVIDHLEPIGLFIHQAHTDQDESLSPKEFVRLLFNARNVAPRAIKKALQSAPEDYDARFVSLIEPFWEELAEEREGVVRRASTKSFLIQRKDQRKEEVRIHQLAEELPEISKLDITIEHAHVMEDLDAQDIHRLELHYVSSTPRSHSANAERQIVSGSDIPQLVGASVSKEIQKTGKIIPLSLLDEKLMKQFRACINHALTQSRKTLD